MGRRSGARYALAAAGLLLVSAPDAAWANCTGVNTTNVVCNPPTPHMQRVGNGPNTTPGTTVTVNDGAQITVGNSNAISLGDNATITIGDNASVTNTATSSTAQTGLWGGGPNTIEFGSNGRLTIGTGSLVTANGSQNNGEPINVFGVGNVITNYGTVSSRSGAAIWFEDRTTGGGNTVDNYGIIRTQLGANANVIGNSREGPVTFINRTGARVEGSLSFAAGNDQLTLEAGSVITGSFNGGGGTNSLTLSGAAGSSDSLAGDIRNFQTLVKDGAGVWTLTGAVGANGGNAPLQVFVNQGTLALTGNNANFSGSITVNPAGILEARAQSLPPTVTDNGLVRFVQDTAGTYAGVISGTGAVEKALGGDLTLSGTNSYSGGTTINAGTVFISSDANLGAASGGLTVNGGALGSVANVATARATTLGPLGGGLNTSAGTTLTHTGTIGGSGQLTKTGTGTAVLTGTNGYTGGTQISAGVLQVGSDLNLGAASGSLVFSGGTLRTTANMTTARTTIVNAAGGTLETASGTTLTHNGTVSGAGTLTKSGAGTLILNGTNTHAGGTTVTGGVLNVTSDANLGAASGALTLDGGTLLTNNDLTIARAGVLGPNGGTLDTAAGTLTYSGTISGSGGLIATGAGGNAILTGSNSYTGATTVAAGYLVINGDQSAATGLTTAAAGGRLSGSGVIGGDVVIENDGILAPGHAPFTPATLTINGSLTLNETSDIFYNIRDTTVGGALNDLTVVHGDLTLDGVVNVLDEGQNLGPGVYRIINYDGALTDNGLQIGAYQSAPGAPTRPLTGFSVQTVVPGQINLINTTGLSLNYWDGSAGPKNDGLIQGGDGTWFNAGPDSTFAWTDPAGAVNAAWADAQFAIFIGAAGTVTASNADGDIHASGMQFGVDGYLLQGDAITLVDSPDAPGVSTIRVGDGTGSGAGITATINAPLIGGTLLRKTDSGTLILNGANGYTGGTRIEGGTIQIAADAALGSAAGGLTLDGGTLRTTTSFASNRSTTLNAGGGTFDTLAGTTFTLGGAITGAGALTHNGLGTLTLTGDSNHAGGTTIAAGTLQLGNGGTTGSITGNILNNAALVANRSDTLTLGGVISGTGSFDQAGAGTTVLTGENTYTGVTTISAGTLQLGNGGTTGSIAGDIVDNATLVIDRSNDITLAGAISGSGSLIQRGSGATFLTGANSYTGATQVTGGLLYVNGDQSAATGDVTVATGAQLGGGGIVGGNTSFADGSALRPGSVPLTPATLTFNQDLTLSDDTRIFYNILNTQVGGALNDLVNVNGDLTLDGTIDVLDQGQTLGPGVYRIFNYAGSLIDNGLEIGSYVDQTGAATRGLDGFIVQTVVPNQVNLVNAAGLALNYWDGSAGPKNDGIIQGGDGTWFNAGPDSTFAWTDPGGATNAPWADDQFAIFIGQAGTVTASNADGQIRVSGMQFGVDGYVLQGDAIELLDSSAGNISFIRVGDGTADSAAMTATISAELTGNTLLIKDDLGTLILSGANTHTNGTGIYGGTLQISADNNLGAAGSTLALVNGGTLRTTASFSTSRMVLLGGNDPLAAYGGAIETAAGTTLTLAGATFQDPAGPGAALEKKGDGTLILTANNGHSGATTISAGTLQLGNGGTTGSLLGDIVDNASLVINRSNTLTLAGVISGTGTLEQAGTGTTILTAENTYTGGTTISAGTLQLGDGGTSGRILGDIVDNGTLIVNRSDTKVLPGSISGTGQLIQAGTGTLVLVNENTYTGGTTISAGTLQIGDGGTTGSIVGDVLNSGVLAFDRADALTFTGAVSGTGALAQAGTGTTILTGANTYTGGTTISAGTLQVGDGGTSGQIFGDVLNDGVLILNRADDILYSGSISGSGSAIKQGAGTLIATGTGTYTGGTTISAGTLQLGDGGTSGSIIGDIVDNAHLVVNRSDSLLFNGTISGSGSFEQAGTGTTIFEADNSYAGGTLISQGTLQIGNGGTTGLVPGDVVNNGTLVINRSNTKYLEGIVSGTGELIQAGLGTLIITNTNSYSGGTAIESGILQISRDDNLGAAGGGLRIGGGTLSTTADMTTARETVLAQEGGTFDVLEGTTLTHSGVIDGAGSLTKIGQGRLRLTGANVYDGPTDVLAGTLLVSGDQSGAIGLTTVASGATLGGIGTIGGSVSVLDGGIFAPGESPGALTINGDLVFSSGSILNYEFGAADVVGGPLNDLAEVAGDLVLDGTINVEIPAGGTFGAGVYRVINYGGTLTDNGLEIGIIPSSDHFVQTSIANQVNLVVTDGLTFRYWDGDAGPKNDGVVNGGNGIWQNSGGNDNWTDAAGTPNAAFTDDSFAVFAGTGGTVTVDASLGAVAVSGMQFAADGYVVQGDSIDLVAPENAIIRVGDGTATGADFTATISSALTGTSGLAKTDLGTLVLTGANSYAGQTTVAAGALYVEGDQSTATGATSVAADAVLGGAGTIGGSVSVGDGGTLSPGSAGATPGTLTIAQDLALAPTARLDYSFGQADVVGGPLNDLVVVGGDLVLDGTIDVTLSPGGSLGPGLYRVIDYAGTLTDNGLEIGATPSPDFVVQTSVANQVNLVNTAGLTLNYWDGDAGGRNDGIVSGGDGIWQNADGNDNWTTVSGTPNAPFADASFAIFAGTSGTVTVDGGLGPVRVAGMQFATDGYVVQGGPVELTGAEAIVRVGDGTAGGASTTATIASALTGASTLTKTDLGTLVLSGANSYTGGTAINGGTVRISSDTNLGAATGALSLDGGTLGTTADITTARATSLGTGGGTFETATGTTLGLSGAVSGAGALTKAGGGTLVILGNAAHTGGTTISAGALRIGDGGTTGSLAGDIVNNASLVADRSDLLTLAGVISGTGSFEQAGSGTTVLTGANNYAGPTSVSAGTLIVNGDQGAATGATAVAGGATLGGNGTLGGDVTIADGATLAPGDGGVGTLTVDGALSLGGASLLQYDFGQADVVGGPLNDLVVVGGDLVLDGTIDIALSPGGSLDPGIYRVIDYAGALTDNGLEIGATPSPGFVVQTSVAQQVNLVNTAGLTLNFWDGAAGPKNDGTVNGGDGIWQGSAGNDNWTDAAGTPNAPFTDAAFAIFQGAPGTVTVDTSLGAVDVSGMQFAVDGYVVQGGAINLVGDGASTVRVGDGTAAGAGFTTTIGSVLAGTSGLAKTDLGTLVLTGANTYAGGTAINGGVLQVASDANLGAAAGGLSFNGGTLRTTESFASARATTLDAAGGTFETASGTAFTLGGAIGGAGTLTKAGAGTLILSGINDYAGGTTIGAGTVEIANDANLGAAAGALTLDTGILRTTADIATARAVTLAEGGGVFETADGTALTLQSAVTGPGALAKTGGGALILNAVNGYTGPTSVAAGLLAVGDAANAGASILGPVNVASAGALGGYGRVDGDVENGGTIAVADAAERFAGGGSGEFTIAGTLFNAGLADLAGAGAGNRLVVSDYVGLSGSLNLNVVLAGDGSPADQLVIAGGSATGSTALRITDVGGGGAATPGNGIEVVVAASGATTAPDAFSLSGRVVAGPYEYDLFRGGRSGDAAESWFLRSEYAGPTPPPVPPTPEPPPLYRPEVPTYTATPSMALMYGRSLIGTLHERVGEREQLLGRVEGGAGRFNGAWGRVMGQRTTWDAAPGGVYNEGPAFRASTYALQVGVDVWRGGGASQGLSFAGVYGAFGWNEGIVRDFDLSIAGRVKFDAYSAGAYLTHYGAGGWYADLVVQATRYEARAGSGFLEDMRTRGTGLAASLELGLPLSLGGGFSLEPQAQLIYQGIDFNDSADEAAEVRFDDVESLTGRFGVRLLHNGERPGSNGPRPLTTWVRANVWREFKANPTTSFSSADGFVPFRSKLEGSWAEFGAGVSTELTRGATLFASGSYETAFGQEVESWGVKAGLRFNW